MHLTLCKKLQIIRLQLSAIVEGGGRECGLLKTGGHICDKILYAIISE